jgi:glycosyltransferase involved in cell wall biosynthesis
MLKVSVILPTLNRSAGLRDVLTALSVQSMPAGQFEVIVVDDGCTDDTGDVLGEAWPFALRAIRHANKGAVISRNIAAEAAQGDLLVFVDDDMWLDPDYLEATAGLHACPEPRLGMGSLLPDLDDPRSAFHRLYARLTADEQPFPAEAEVAFTACVTNNLSARKHTFFSIGGFRNPVGDGPGTWTDVDFGCRARRAGVRCWRSGLALCVHRDYSIHDFESARRRAYRVAKAAPALFDELPETRPAVQMFDDKWPVDLRTDGPKTLLRKLFRRLMSSPAALWLLERAAAAASALALPIAILRPLYRWILGADLYRGLRDGLRERSAASAGGEWTLPVRSASKG